MILLMLQSIILMITLTPMHLMVIIIIIAIGDYDDIDYGQQQTRLE